MNRLRPWYFTALLTLGAWLTALAVVTAMATTLRAFHLDKNGLGIAIFGIALWAVTLFPAQKVKSYFFKEILTTIAIGGAIGLFAGIDERYGSAWAFLISLVLCSAHCRITRHYLSRFVLILCAFGLGLMWTDEQGKDWMNEIYTAAALASALFINIRPIPGINLTAISSALLSAVFLGTLFLLDAEDFHPFFMLSGALIFAYILYLQRQRLTASEAAICGGLAIALVLSAPPSTTAACIILTLGWLKGDMRRTILGLIFLVASLLHIYLILSGDLLFKSATTAAVGSVILAIWGFQKRRKASEHET